MQFDINEITAEMLAAIKDEVGNNWNSVKGIAEAFMQNRKDRLELLCSLHLSGEIANTFFDKRIEDEKLILESELHSIAIITKVSAQNAANKAIEILLAALVMALKIIV